jgi:hypothetical protein
MNSLYPTGKNVHSKTGQGKVGTQMSAVGGPVNSGLRSSCSLGAAQPPEADYQALIDAVEAERRQRKANRPWLYKPYDVSGRQLRRAVGLLRDGESYAFAASASRMTVKALTELVDRMTPLLLAGHRPRKRARR